MELGLRSLGGGARADKDKGRGNAAAQCAAEEIRAPGRKFSGSRRIRDGCDHLTHRGAGSESERDGCQNEAIADRRSSCHRIDDSRCSCHRIDEPRSGKPDPCGHRQHSARGRFADTKAEGLSDSSPALEGAVGCGAGDNPFCLDDARDPDGHDPRGAGSHRHARPAYDQSNPKTAAGADASAGATQNPAVGSRRHRHAGSAGGRRDDSCNHSVTCAHSAAKAAQRAATRPARGDSRSDDPDGASTRSA